MKYILMLLSSVVLIESSRAAIFTNSADADAFVRSNAPTLNYGKAGALSVSGSTSTNTLSGLTNGIADAFIRFNTAATVTNFNSLFGPNNWVITSARLQVVESGTPNNSIFDQGKGAFEIYWTTGDNWNEGTGTPMAPTTDGIAYNNEATLLANTASLGIYTNAGINFTNSFSLALPAAFASDAAAGGEVTLFLTAVDAGIGFTFNSKDFGTASARPFLILSALPQPGINAVNVSGADVILSATNGAASGTYQVLASTNAALPLSQWLPIATNVLSSNGNFSITVTNAVNSASSQQFFILQTQ